MTNMSCGSVDKIIFMNKEMENAEFPISENDILVKMYYRILIKFVYIEHDPNPS